MYPLWFLSLARVLERSTHVNWLLGAYYHRKTGQRGCVADTASRGNYLAQEGARKKTTKACDIA